MTEAQLACLVSESCPSRAPRGTEGGSCQWSRSPSVTGFLGLLAAAVIAAFGASAASARTTTVGLGGWQVQSSAQATQSGAQVSTPAFATGSWLHVRPDDGGAVGSEVNALVQNGHCPNVFFSTNMKDCFGYMDTVGPETIPQFSVPWWFRTDFRSDGHAVNTDLIVNGVVGEADVWVNGHQVATRATVQGDYTRYTFDVSGLLHRGANTLALEVYPNDPSTMFTLDNVDWTQIPPDNNTGIQFPIQLHSSGPLALSNSHVVQDNAADMSTSSLTVKADVTNHADQPRDRRAVGDRRRAVRTPDPRSPLGDGGPRSDADRLVLAGRCPRC